MFSQRGKHCILFHPTNWMQINAESLKRARSLVNLGSCGKKRGKEFVLTKVLKSEINWGKRGQIESNYFPVWSPLVKVYRSIVSGTNLVVPEQLWHSKSPKFWNMSRASCSLYRGTGTLQATNPFLHGVWTVRLRWQPIIIVRHNTHSYPYNKGETWTDTYVGPSVFNFNWWK